MTGLNGGGGGGGWKLVSSAEASNDASIEFTEMEEGYDYQFRGSNILPVTDNVIGRFLLGVDGATYRAANYKGVITHITNTSSVFGGNHSSAITIQSTGNSNAANKSISFILDIFDPAKPTRKTHFMGNSAGHNGTTGTAYINSRMPGLYGVAEAHKAVKFLFLGSNISVGEFSLHRKPK